jgi:hypothetical protein
MGVLTENYYFMRSVKKAYNFDLNSGFPSEDLMFDIREKSIFRYILYNRDYSDKEFELMSEGPWRPISKEIPIWKFIQAHELVAARDKGQLKGRLKEIATTLNEEDNPVIMLIKHKKQ